MTMSSSSNTRLDQAVGLVALDWWCDSVREPNYTADSNLDPQPSRLPAQRGTAAR